MAAGPRRILEEMHRNLWEVTEGEMTVKQFRERYVFALEHAKGADYIGDLLCEDRQHDPDKFRFGSTDAWNMLLETLNLTEMFDDFQGSRNHDTWTLAYDGSHPDQLFQVLRHIIDLLLIYSEEGSYEQISQRHIDARRGKDAEAPAQAQ